MVMHVQMLTTEYIIIRNIVVKNQYCYMYLWESKLLRACFIIYLFIENDSFALMFVKVIGQSLERKS